MLVFAVLAAGLVSFHTAAAETSEKRACGEDLFSIGEKIVVEKTQVVTGDVVCIGADIEISGTVKGDVVSIGGNLVLGAKARVEGDAVAVGGKIEKHKNAEILGESVSIGIWLDMDEGGCDANSSI
jgi:hypothetical protein